MTRPLVQVQNLEVQFRRRSRATLSGVGRGHTINAVSGVSFSIARGETLGLVGESGCGKTTLGRAMLGLARHSGGRVLFAGEDVSAMTPEAEREFRRNAQILFQDPGSSLNPRITVGSSIEEVLAVHGLAGAASARRARRRELLHLVGLGDEHADRYPHEVSAGQRQRVGIARALAVEPAFLVCDEPVSALDVSVQAQVLELLMRLQADLGLTYLFIAHDLAVVQRVSDRVAVMYAGRLVEIGTVRALYRNPEHPYTRALLAALPGSETKSAWGPERKMLRGDPPAGRETIDGCAFYARCPHPLKDEVCRESVPQLGEGAPGHFVACAKSRHRDTPRA